jgi:hypothetical protein
VPAPARLLMTVARWRFSHRQANREQQLVRIRVDPGGLRWVKMTRPDTKWTPAGSGERALGSLLTARFTVRIRAPEKSWLTTSGFSRYAHSGLTWRRGLGRAWDPLKRSR